MTHSEYTVKGIHCRAGAVKVEKALKKAGGVGAFHGDLGGDGETTARAVRSPL